MSNLMDKAPMHTPPPWVTFDFGGTIMGAFAGFGICKQGTSLAIITGDDSGLVCLFEGNDPVDRANAKLMAAAPELLEALQWALRELHGQNRYDEDVAEQQENNCYLIAEAAIAKATKP